MELLPAKCCLLFDYEPVVSSVEHKACGIVLHTWYIDIIYSLPAAFEFFEWTLRQPATETRLAWTTISHVASPAVTSDQHKHSALFELFPFFFPSASGTMAHSSDHRRRRHLSRSASLNNSADGSEQPPYRRCRWSTNVVYHNCGFNINARVIARVKKEGFSRAEKMCCPEEFEGHTVLLFSLIQFCLVYFIHCKWLFFVCAKNRRRCRANLAFFSAWHVISDRIFWCTPTFDDFQPLFILRDDAARANTFAQCTMRMWIVIEVDFKRQQGETKRKPSQSEHLLAIRSSPSTILCYYIGKHFVLYNLCGVQYLR